MSKIITICVFCFLSFSSVAIISPKYMSENFQFKGDCKNLTIRTYKAIDRYHTVEVGDLVGLVTSVGYKNGELQNIYEFNEQGEAQFWYEIDFDKKGFLQSEKKYGEIGDLDAYTQLKLGSNKEISERLVFKNNGVHLYSELYTYDKKGNLVEEKKVDPKNIVIEKTLYTYDTAARLQTKTKYKENLNLQYKDFFEYENGRLVLEERYGSDDALVSRKDFKYDDKGNILGIRKVAPNTQDVETSFVYEFDSKGNWIKKIVYKNKLFPTAIVFRDIEY